MCVCLAALLCLLQQGSAALAFEAAARALSRGELAAAERGFQAVLAVEPANIGALGNLGVVYSRLDRPSEAIAIYRRALKIAPGERGLLLNLGLAQLKVDRYAEAKGVFQSLAAMGNPAPQVRELLATARLFTGEVDVALADLRKLESEGAASPAVLYLLAIGALKQKDEPAAARAFDALMAKLTPAQGSYLRGKAYLETGSFEEAERSLLEAGPGAPGVSLELGKVYVSLRKEAEAVAAFRAALAESPQDTEASYYLGALLPPGEGIPLLEQVRRKRPDSWGAHYYLGKALLREGRAAEALAPLESAAKLNPSESTIWFQLAQAYRKLGRAAAAQTAAAKFKTLKRAANAPLVLK